MAELEHYNDINNFQLSVRGLTTAATRVRSFRCDGFKNISIYYKFCDKSNKSNISPVRPY